MNIIIPLGGRGERFSKNGNVKPKPLIQIFEKTMIEYVIDNLECQQDDKIFIIYNSKLDDDGFSDFIKSKYSKINLIKITQNTRGAAETLFYGIGIIITQQYTSNNKCLILDCDTFYTQNIVDIFKKVSTNAVFYTNNYDTNPIYSYIKLGDENKIIDIKEKIKISDNANTGAYAFNYIEELWRYCKHVVDSNITFNNEPYTSCVISEMIQSGIVFKGIELDDKCVFSLGTPQAVETYMNQTCAFLFDLDGTLVVTDEIYFDVWSNILSRYNIALTHDMYAKYIHGNNDSCVLNTLLKNTNTSLNELSELKNTLFIKNINKLELTSGGHELLIKLKKQGHKACIVTNCNKSVASEICNHVGFTKRIDFYITSSDCIHGKPHSEPYMKSMAKYNIECNKCFIFEDSKTGILSAKGANPNMVIGIETSYDSDELIKYGVDYTVKNFDNFDTDALINKKVKECGMVNLKNIIFENSTIHNIKDIIIDSDKLKGGYIADVVSYDIITTSGKYSQILKYENVNENNLSIIAKKIQLYEREYYFYTNMSMYMNIKIPKFYNLTKNKKFQNTGIVLENLFKKNYKLNLNLNLESIDVALRIVNDAAKMHSKFWNKDLKRMFPGLKCSTDEIFCPFFTEFIDERFDKFITKWSHILPKKNLDKCHEIKNNFSKIQRSFATGKNLTFIHGDIKSPNIFYDVENNFEPYFIDWQHCAVGKGVQDIIFFIIESFDIYNISITFKLIKHYYYCKLMEYGVVGYSVEEYNRDIYDAVCYIPFFTSMWFGTMSQDELIDKNFPYFLINKMFYLFELIEESS
jgi:beta-phosphoglucomutase-like phosphatase (HAD superfamily)/choline kinase